MLREPFYPIEFTEIGPDILYTRFLREDLCSLILNTCLSINTWSRNPRLPYHTDDIHFEKDLPNWKDLLETGLSKALEGACEHWGVEDDVSIASIFAIRYTLETSTNLKQHHDDSYISGSIKLNGDYTGGLLNFPKQNFNNQYMGIGDLILWPGQLTHPHESKPISSGEKYSITIWTKNESLENHR